MSSYKFFFILLISIAMIGCKSSNKISEEKSQESLVINGQPNAEIIIVPTASRSTKLAAKEFQRYIQLISGARLAILNQKSEKENTKIFIGNKEIANFPIDEQKLKHDGFYTSFSNGVLYLIGNDKNYVPKEPYAHSRKDQTRALKEWNNLTGEQWDNPFSALFKDYNEELNIWEYDERGTINAVYHIIKSLGVRWYMPGELGMVIPELKNIKLENRIEYVQPEFEVRSMIFNARRFSQATKDDVWWCLQMGLNVGEGLVPRSSPGHGMKVVHSHPKIRESKLDYYAVYKGQKDNFTKETGKPCLSSKRLFEDHVKYVRWMFDHFEEDVVSIMPPDGYWRFCECALCAGKGDKGRGKYGRISNYVWSYLNDVAKEVYKTHPNKKVQCFAYGAYTMPPKEDLNISPNFQVDFVRNTQHLLDPKMKKMYDNSFKRWRELTGNKKFVLWNHYRINDIKKPTRSTPGVFPHLIQEDLLRIQDEIKGELIEVYRDRKNLKERDELQGIAINHVNIYFTALMLWDLDIDLDTELEEYYTLFYGSAREEMKTFFTQAEAEWPNFEKNPQLKNKFQKMLSKAKGKVPTNSKFAQRIELIIKLLNQPNTK